MNTWNALAGPAVDWLASTSWQAAVLAVLVVCVQITCRIVLSARWRYLLWILVVARLLFPSLPECSMSLYRYVPPSPVTPIRFDQAVSPAVAAPPMTTTAATSAFVPSVSALPVPVSASISVKGVLFAIWLAGFLVLAVSLVERNVRFRRRVQLDARPADDAKRKLADSVAREMGVKRGFVVIETGFLETPAVVGLFAPKLLLPREVAARLSSDELTLIFRHELAHLKRGDLWVNFLVCLLQIVHWFNPVLWWAFGRMRHDRELATDALALRSSLHAQQAYGETLVKLAAGNVPRISLNPAIGILENHRRIRQRVEQIARLKPNAYAWSALGVALLVLLALLALTKAPVLGATREDNKRDSSRELRFRFVVDKKDVKLDAPAQAHVIGEIEAVIRGVDVSANRNPGNSFNSLTPDMIEKDGNYLHVAYPTPRTFATAKGSIRAREVYIVNYPYANLFGFPPGGIVLVSETGQLTHAYDCVAEAPLLNLTFSPDVYPHLSDRNKANFNDELSGYFNFSKEEELEPPLRIIAAAKAGDLTEIKALLAQGVKLDQLPGGETTLLFAAGSPEVAEFLISQGVPVDARNKGRFTALMAICYNDRGSRKDELIAPTARVLLKHGADPNAHTEVPRIPGWTPLMLARDGVTVDALVEGGADVHARFNGLGLLDELDLGYKQLSYFQALAAHGLSIDNHANGLHLLNWAVYQDFDDLVDWLLKRGVDPNATDPVNAMFQGSFPARPMMVAAGSGAARAAKLLITHGGKIDDAAIDLALDDQRDNVLEVFHEAGSGNFPELLYQVSQKAQAEKIEALLKTGAPADPPGGHMTPLALAARHGDLASVQVLVQYGADPNRKGTAGTPLGLAAAGGHEEVVNFLLQKGAHPDLETMNAAIWGCIAQTQFYKHAGPLDPQPFYRSIQALAKAGGYRDIRPDQMTAAFLNGTDRGFSLDPEIVKIQLAVGVNPSSKDVKGQSALDAVEAAYAKDSDTRTRAHLQQIINLFTGARSATPYDMPQKPMHTSASRTDRFGRPTVDVTITPIPPPGIEWTKMAVETQGGGLEGTVTADGKSLQVQMIAGETMLRTVCRTASGRLYFSDCQRFQVTDKQLASGQPLQVNFATTLPGFDFKGQLDPSVPRPVKNGLAVACVSTGMSAPNVHTWLMWSKSAPVHADGTFEISNLPPPTAAIATDDTAGPLQLIVTCDGYVSKDPAAAQFEYSAGSQTFAPPIAQPLTIAMESTGSARVHVLDPNGKPVPNALVQFSPNETFRSGSVLWYSTMLGGTWDDEKQLFKEETPHVLVPGDLPLYQQLQAKYQAVTNSDGFANVGDLPPGLVPYTVEKTPYAMPYRLRLAGSLTKYAQDAIVTVKSGLQATTEIRLIPKMAPIRIADSTSPDGKHVISVESSRDSAYGGPGPQSIVVRDAKTGESKSATFLPANSENQEDLITASDKLEVKWNRASSFFIFAAWHVDHFDVLGVILSPQQNQLGLACSNLSQGMDGKVLSCDFIDPNTMHVKVLRGDGLNFDFYWTMNANGQFEGSSSPPTRKV